MKIVITRIRKDTLATDGRLTIDGQHICDTAEATPFLMPEGTYKISIVKCPRLKRQMPFIHKYTLLSPTGEKRVATKCERCREQAVCRNNIRMAAYNLIEQAMQENDSREEINTCEEEIMAEARNKLAKVGYTCCPQLAFGNGVYNRKDGQIIVGTHLLAGVVVRSRESFDRLYDRIEKAISRGKDVQFVIR